MAYRENDYLTTLAEKYLWWISPDEALRRPEKIVAQVMDLGDFDDVVLLMERIGEERVKEVVRHAEAGQFSLRSWHYWHYRLGLADIGTVPPLPQRKVC
jgi:hypothetical protein